MKQYHYTESNKVIAVANTDIENLSLQLDTSIGIKENFRSQQKKKYGGNEIIVPKFHHVKKFFEALTEPFNLLLWLIAIGELLIYIFITDEGKHDLINLISSLIVFFMIFLAAVIDYIQEFKAYKTNIELNKIIENSFWVLNGSVTNFNDLSFLNIKNKLISCDQSQLLYGDVIVLHQGDIVPADARILWTNNFTVNQSSLTGEAEPVEKLISNSKERLIELDNILFAQTVIATGTCIAVIINVGEKNYASSILQMVNDDEPSEYEKGLTKITRILVASILVMVPIIMIAAGLRSGGTSQDWVSALIFALSIAVALTPEALPAIISSNLKLGSKKMAKEKVVIKKLSVVQNMGSVDILATDKTGTLTLDKVQLNSCQNFNNQEDPYLLRMLFLNASFQQNLSNKIDQAIIDLLASQMDLSNVELVEDQAFSHQTRISSVLVKENDHYLQISKGSVDEILNQSKFIRLGKKVVILSDELVDMVKQTIDTWTKQGFRSILISTAVTTTLKDTDLVLEGMALFEDVLKNDVVETLEIIKKYSIDLKILTGDAQDIALNIAHQINLKTSRTLSGEQLENYSSAELQEILKLCNVLAKLSPTDKTKIIETLKINNVIAFLGDGINDAGALRAADVGISVNNGTPLAKSAADVILLEKDLRVLENAFVQGREIFANAIKYIKITVASNFGMLLTLLISSLWLEFPSMSPIQLLLQNLIFDFANLIFVFDSVDNSSIRKPQKWNAKSIIPFGLWNGLVLTIISILNFLILGFVFGLLTNGVYAHETIDQQQFQTAFFLESILTHILIILVYRTEHISFIKARPTKTLVYGLLGFALIPFLFIGLDNHLNNLGFKIMSGTHQGVNLGWWYLVLVGLLVLAWVLAELFKKCYKKVFKSWL
ncbi:magnesium transporter [Mesoplasma syrphidae]|uniref:Magnesium transporter n=1 Tax=Mesoplasma syrphidae TaxID=225999 RepID=A0A2K9C8B8_9MOLU|nr:HAD-IC family P-type ATPase [Mesoplasma syrphidae]AUF83255.1 magnesium transporter [Mesoplasma syrphidae]